MARVLISELQTKLIQYPDGESDRTIGIRKSRRGSTGQQFQEFAAQRPPAAERGNPAMTNLRARSAIQSIIHREERQTQKRHSNNRFYRHSQARARNIDPQNPRREKNSRAGNEESSTIPSADADSRQKVDGRASVTRENNDGNAETTVRSQC
jgi:hypothetical protein